MVQINIHIMIATTPERSKHLLELGLDPKTADMMWDDWSLINEGWKLSVGYYSEIEKDYGRKCYPAWSLSALLEVMKEHCPELLFLEAYWYCRCVQVESEYCDDPITAAYDVLCWLLEQGFIKKGDNDE